MVQVSVPRSWTRTDQLAALALTAGVLALVALALAGLGTRWRWWDFRTGFLVLRWSAVAGLSAAALSLIAFGLLVAGRRRTAALAAIGLVCGLFAFGLPWSWMRTAQRVPPIHDITTDTDDPPLFQAVLALRREAPNPADYGGAEVAAQQRAAYPDLVPLILPVAPATAFERALLTAHAMGWKIHAGSVEHGRIEATDTTFWFGFKDDVVVRITPADGGSRIDVRSVSRVGKSDVGTNAARIRSYRRKLRAINGAS
jgi:uncharacterized protein (DUF1499 family)